ncbi:hypothetical protein GWK47_026362 [Chionoecetes opilio]|uniref:CHK kinase-like domain-containing protein n=1 Tax=Chionoecetes opilio TaxID=41210 RepID=A0A8J8WAE7_CHIOP|nr:hypothetical protein GWK47_026362 [Chionoecetes opilio]
MEVSYLAEAEDTTKKYGPLTDDLLRNTLRKDKGDAAELVSWKCEDFTKKGDNYASFVTSVKVQYREAKEGALKEASYVAKIAHQLEMETKFRSITNEVFEKEGCCFIEILPKMNQAMRELHLDAIRTAEGYCVSLELGKEVLMVEDLRARHFKMCDRRRGMDVLHATLVLKELGRMHAASLVVEKLGCSLTETWPVIVEKWVHREDSSIDMFIKILAAQFEGAAMIMEKIPKYEHVVEWIRELKPRAMQIFKDALLQGLKFSVLTHGDCWSNNVLFRYDAEGAPVEVMLVDLQGMRMASAGTDLSYFLYSSFTGNIRKNNFNAFITTYYDSFSSVLQAAGMPVPFSQEELLQELRDKMTFGCVLGMIFAPIVLSEEQDIIGFFDISEETIDKDSQERQETVTRIGERGDGQLRDRFLSMFDEMVEAGIVSRADAAAQ